VTRKLVPFECPTHGWRLDTYRTSTNNDSLGTTRSAPDRHFGALV